MKQKVLIVGGVAGGASAAARLRRLDEEAEIILFERGEYISFANCGLPYHIGGTIREEADLILNTPQGMQARFRLDVRVLTEVIAIDRQRKIVVAENLRTGERCEESYDKLILSPGAAPIVPPLEGIKSSRVFTLRNIPDTRKIKAFINREKPRSAVVAGGGFIGVEMAENLVEAGLSVSLVELSDQVLPPLDGDMACQVHRYLAQKGVKLYLGTGLQKVQETESGLHLALTQGSLEAEMLILAVGVRPESGLAKAAGLLIGERGGIVTDRHMRTSDEDIYAVGDAVETWDFVTGQKAMVPLAGPANKQGRIAADHICGLPSAYGGTQGSAVLKVFGMTVASTGINEKTAKAQGLDFDKSFTFSGSHAGYYPGAEGMTLKTLFEKQTGRILGCQIIGGQGVDKRCDVMAVAIRAGMTAADLTRLELCYAPPYSSAKDPVNMAGYVIENLVSGQVKNFHWHDIPALQSRADVTLVDVRTPSEYAAGHIDGFVNIPLDSLRSRMGEIPKNKPIYVVCQIGLRGYLAARILKQKGYEVYNLSGGYRLYEYAAKRPGA